MVWEDLQAGILEDFASHTGMHHDRLARFFAETRPIAQLRRFCARHGYGLVGLTFPADMSAEILAEGARLGCRRSEVIALAWRRARAVLAAMPDAPPPVVGYTPERRRAKYLRNKENEAAQAVARRARLIATSEGREAERARGRKAGLLHYYRYRDEISASRKAAYAAKRASR